MKQNILKLTAVIFFIIGAVPANAQEINVVTTAVPFLRIAPDARAAAMGDLGVATTPDANASFWNLGKLPFNKNRGGISVFIHSMAQRFVKGCLPGGSGWLL